MESARRAKTGPGRSQPHTACPKKFACPDCSCCQFCSDSRCNCCQRSKTAGSSSKMSISEQIRLYDEINANDPLLKKRSE